MNLYYAEGNRQFGPIGKAELQNLIKTKKLTAKSLVWEPGMESWQELGLYVRGKIRGPQSSEMQLETAAKVACSQCGGLFSLADTVLLKNSRVCASCKPLVLQKIKEGVSIRPLGTSDKYGSLAKGISGQYQINISEIISEAWQMTNGSKLVILGSVLVAWIVSAIIQQIISIPMAVLFGIFAVSFEKSMGTPESAVMLSGGLIMVTMLLGIVSMMAQAPMLVGLEMIGVRRSADLSISVKYVFHYFKHFIPIALTWAIMCILIFLGFLLAIIPGIYLSVATFLALQLVADRQMGPWKAVKTSIKAINHNWFPIFGLLFVLSLIMAVSCIPLGIGLIWTLPLFFISKGILYRNIFGVQEIE